MSVNIEEIKEKLYTRLKPSGWADKLKTFILSEDFDKIIQKLESDSVEGKRFVPQLKYLFSAFEDCPYDKLRIVLIGQDPYPYLNIPDGKAFSCSLTMKPQKSLDYMLGEIKRTVYESDPELFNPSPDLKRWSEQGVLLLNSALTVPVGKPGYHQIMWRPFMAFLLDILGWYNPGLIYMFMGNVAKNWAESIPDNNHKLYCTHPAFAAHRDLSEWDSYDIFNKVNKILEKTNGEKIIW